MHTFCFSSHVSVRQDKVIDFLASAQGSVLLNVMALTGDSHKPERLCLNEKQGANAETFSAVGKLLDRQHSVVRHF